MSMLQTQCFQLCNCIGSKLVISKKKIVTSSKERKILTMSCIVEWPITGWLISFSSSMRGLKLLKKGVFRAQ
uniref:Uncharacterized protein n=1 Tax=Nelumbo nucifera TaxID=4432 RepID=A0A822YBE5_NELNU|nr:TPA_asm: hypothetical protein HUJ06_031225 [Nelumbo nucifera]